MEMNSQIKMTKQQHTLLAESALIMAAFGLFFALTSPYALHADLGYLLRVGAWTKYMLVGCSFGWEGFLLCRRLFRIKSLLTEAVIISNFVAVGIMILVGYEQASSVNTIQLPDILIAYFQIFAISFLISITHSHFLRSQVKQKGASPSISKRGVPKTQDLEIRQQTFRSQWPWALRNATLYAVAAEDHYVRLFTSKGEALVLGKFGDAISLLEVEEQGCQVHRSWWVSLAAIEDVEKKEGQYQLHLKDGQMISVARSRVPAIREAGII